MKEPMWGLLVCIAAMLITWAGVGLTRRYARQFYPSLYPSSDVPRGGGVIILMVILLMFMPIAFWLGDPSPVVRYAMAGSMIAAIGFFDDLRNMSRSMRIFAQVMAALIFVPVAPVLSIGLPAMNVTIPTWLGYVFSTVWIVVLSNIYSYMDDADGLAGGNAVIVSLLWAAVAWVTDDAQVFMLSVIMVGTMLGFLVYNVPPARIFMGEVGSTFIGFSLACLPLLMQSYSPRLIISGTLFVGLFIFDAVLTLVLYIVRGRYRQHSRRSHLYQRLLQLGDPPGQITLLYLSITCCFGLIGLLYWRQPSWIALLICGLACAFLFAWIKSREWSNSVSQS